MKIKLNRNYKSHKKNSIIETVDKVEIEYLKSTGTGVEAKEEAVEITNQENNSKIERETEDESKEIVVDKELLEEQTVAQLKDTAKSLGIELESTKKTEIIEEIIAKTEAENEESI